ncbi:hypothetical protein J0S82_018335 [Galemys pyrenaicus]|uniref:Uncharacterized protein n=1 Tax=Galemys pyrenaicus TaxID=202257 RepID=A0A8J5ZR33_GALPY|nr:hypothetical protein J0S82_018335 [Galemys pyrenaicus]
MEAAQGQAGKSFSYTVRVPGGDGWDVMSVDVKIDTRWVFQGAAAGGEGLEEERAAGLEELAGRPAAGAASLGRQLQPPEQKLVAAADEPTEAAAGLRRR